MKSLEYPETFLNFGGGVEIDDETIRLWIRQGIDCVKERLRDGHKEAFTTTASGNSLVLVEGYKYRGNAVIHVSVSKGYQNAVYSNVKL